MVLCGTWSETSVAQSQLTQFWANSKTHNAFLFTVNAIFLRDYPLAVEPGSTPRPLVQKRTWRDSLPTDMLLSAVSGLVVAQSSSEIPEGLMNNPVYDRFIAVCCSHTSERTILFLQTVNWLRHAGSTVRFFCLQYARVYFLIRSRKILIRLSFKRWMR